MTQELTGTFSKATYIPPFVFGIIKNDTKGRFQEGDFIRTSAVEEIEDDIVITTNSTYRVEEWSHEPKH